MAKGHQQKQRKTKLSHAAKGGEKRSFAAREKSKDIQFSKPADQPKREYHPQYVSKKRCVEQLGIILENKPNEDHALLDSGDGLKLEQYGDLRIIRPDAQALWQRELEKHQWDAADAIFTGDTKEEGTGRWAFPKQELPPFWNMRWNDMNYYGRFTSFRHLGVFPEQSVHWQNMIEQINTCLEKKSECKVLNLFGYTGIASLIAAKAGAHVTHVDASKKAIGWARENQQIAGLEEKPIRWICEDAVKFCERETRRDNHYDIILLDPPNFGRGPKGEVWQLFDDLPYLLDQVRSIINLETAQVVLTAYAIRASFFSMHEIMQEKFGDCGGKLESGELVLCTKNSDRKISTSLFSRWSAQ